MDRKVIKGLSPEARHICAALIIFFLLAIYLVPHEFIDIEVCLFKKIFRAECPLCGITRSLYHTARGDIAAAYNFSPFGIIIFTLIAASSPVFVSEKLHSAAADFINSHRSLMKILVMSSILLLMLSWIIRIL
jgi:hypothetical protein